MLRNIMAMFVLFGVIAGCNTFQGAGKDIEKKVGRKFRARQKKAKMTANV
ncbi:entericidin EcnA/B family protein [Undibacterium arcticum]